MHGVLHQRRIGGRILERGCTVVARPAQVGQSVAANLSRSWHRATTPSNALNHCFHSASPRSRDQKAMLLRTKEPCQCAHALTAFGGRAYRYRGQGCKLSGGFFHQ
ncbi:hypothetical protein QYE76_013732 [Lolium multiflorum]|uniref:Uncharacterized protein n=1 Tax=Lolium multiflorum TaxID=4521 RepID=A0AAD8U3N5_LOLMU|nr:hypothetical protein QYE76_013732 [Lolium multiflorum]